MIRNFLIALLFAAPLAAEYESNFGRVILAESDVIVQGVASAKRTRVNTAFRVEVTVQDVLYGEEENTDVSVYYTGREVLEEGTAVRGLFALKSLSEGGYSLVGKPVLTPEGDAEEHEKLKVARAFIALEKLPEGDKRTMAFWALLNDHIRMGGHAAQNASVELMFVARDRSGVVTLERFEDVVASRDDSLGVLTTQCRKDLKLAFQGLVEARVKDLKFRKVRRGDNKDEKRDAAGDLIKLRDAYPRAFTKRDALLCDALVEVSEDRFLTTRLKDLAKEIRAEIRVREAEEKAKAKKVRDRIKHANE